MSQKLKRRKFRVGKENRKNYIYYLADGTKVIIQAGENGVNDEMIAKLHALDDEEFHANQREDYRFPVHLGNDVDEEFKNTIEKNPCFIDADADPLKIIMEVVMEQEHAKDLERLKKALDSLSPLQKKTVYKKYYLNMTNTAIALEEGVLEGAIRHRLTKIFEKLSNNMNKY